MIKSNLCSFEEVALATVVRMDREKKIIGDIVKLFLELLHDFGVCMGGRGP